MEKEGAELGEEKDLQFPRAILQVAPVQQETLLLMTRPWKWVTKCLKPQAAVGMQPFEMPRVWFPPAREDRDKGFNTLLPSRTFFLPMERLRCISPTPGNLSQDGGTGVVAHTALLIRACTVGAQAAANFTPHAGPWGGKEKRVHSDPAPP